jgi:hypothetical protein
MMMKNTSRMMMTTKKMKTMGTITLSTPARNNPMITI